MRARSIAVCGIVTGLIIGLGLIVGPSVPMLTNRDTYNDGFNYTYYQYILGKPDLNHFYFKYFCVYYINCIRINISKITLYGYVLAATFMFFGVVILCVYSTLLYGYLTRDLNCLPIRDENGNSLDGDRQGDVDGVLVCR